MDIAFKPYPFAGTQYPVRIPPLDGRTDSRRHPVAIVGGGPVGLTAALGLARQGIGSVVIEADDSVCTGSRAICISRRILEIIERLGAVDAFLDKGLPWTGGRSFYRDTEVLHFTMPQDENRKLPPMVNLAQYHIEQFLLDAAIKQPELIDIRWQTRVTAVTNQGSGVTLQLASPAGDYALEAHWLLACDGGRSARSVRRRDAGPWRAAAACAPDPGPCRRWAGAVCARPYRTPVRPLWRRARLCLPGPPRRPCGRTLACA